MSEEPKPDPSAPSAIDQILKYTGLIYAMLVFIGFMTVHAYYRQFGIEIWTHLTTSELLLSFLPLAVGILGFVGAVFMGYMAPAIYLKQPSSLPTKRTTPQKSRPIHDLGKRARVAWRRKKWKLWFGYMARLLMASATRLYLLWGISVMAEIIRGKVMRTYEVSFVWAFGALWLVVLFFVAKDTKGFTSTELKRVMVLATFVVTCSVSIQHGTMKAAHLLDTPMEAPTVVTTSYQTFASDSTLLFVGKTQEAVFFFDAKTSIATTIPMADVERIDQKKSMSN